MIDAIINFLTNFWTNLTPLFIVNQNFNSVHLRGGKYKRVCMPGVYFKMPFYDEILEHTVAWTTISLPAQSLTTSDAVTIVIKCVVKYKVVSVEVFMLEVWDATDAISDMTQGIVFDVIKNLTWAECKHDDIKNQVTIKTRREAKRWGLNIESVTISDLAIIKTLRIINDQITFP
jgi:regulator of protease activity HflC (stomatin/prohibitin superfamily)